MLARRPFLLSQCRLGGCVSAAYLPRRSASGVRSSLRTPLDAGVGSCQHSGALAMAKRRYPGSAVIPNFTTHCTQIGACGSLSTILYSPIGTAMLIVLAYNVIVICTKHVHYSLEITAKDYVQDQQLLTIMRYGILCCILLGMEVMFIEV